MYVCVCVRESERERERALTVPYRKAILTILHSSVLEEATSMDRQYG